MKHEYTISEFIFVVDALIRLVPDMQITTDVICGLPSKTREDNLETTINLIKEYKFLHVQISQFYPRPGMRAARMRKVPTSKVMKQTTIILKN